MSLWNHSYEEWILNFSIIKTVAKISVYDLIYKKNNNSCPNVIRIFDLTILVRSNWCPLTHYSIYNLASYNICSSILASEYHSSRTKYEENARQLTKKHAMSPTWDELKQVCRYWLKKNWVIVQFCISLFLQELTSDVESLS